jgi:hypothetical protein
MNRFAAAVLFAALSLTSSAQEAGKPAPPPDDRNEDRLLERDPGAPRPARPDAKQKPEAEPMVIEPAVEVCDAPHDHILAPRADGFAALEPGADGHRIIAYDRDGKPVGELGVSKARIDRWWIAATGKRVAWVAGGRLWTAAGAGALDLDAAPTGAPAFSADGAKIAYVLDGKIVVRGTDGSAATAVAAEADLLLAGSVALARDGSRVFVLVAAKDATRPDGVGAADLKAAATVIKRLTTAANAILQSLSLSPDEKWLIYVQRSVSEPQADALRLLSADASEFRTLARAPLIAAPRFTPDGASVVFSGRGANSMFSLYRTRTELDPALGEHVTTRLNPDSGAGYHSPVPTADGAHVFAIRSQDEGSGPVKVVRVKVR